MIWIKTRNLIAARELSRHARRKTARLHENDPYQETDMRTLLMLAIGVPLPIIALYWLFG